MDWLLGGRVGLSFAAPSDLRLIQAVKKQDVESVRALLKQHVDVNAAQGDGTTALHWAADVDNLAIADLLIRAGARVNAANDLGATPLYLACRNRSATMVDRLLAAGANANAKLLNGETALMTCARTGEPKAVKALLVHGADAKAKEPEHDQTALMWAAAQSHPEAVAMLIEFGADVRARSRIYSQTVVGEQTQRAGREELNYTVQRGGMTPLLFAARNGDAESAKLLLAAGADANDSLPDGTSALVLAAHSGQGNVADRTARERCGSQCPGQRLYGDARRGSQERPQSGEGAAGPWSRSEYSDDKGHSGAPRHHRLQFIGAADRLDSLSAGSEISGAGDHADAGSRWRGSENHNAERCYAAHAGGRHGIEF